MSDDEARTDTVDLLHSYPHHQPKTGSDFIESEYYTSLIYLPILIDFLYQSVSAACRHHISPKNLIVERHDWRRRVMFV